MGVVPLRRPLFHASYEVALQCTDIKILYTMAEKLVKPCGIKMVELVWERMLPEILPMYRSPTISSRVMEMSSDVLDRILMSSRLVLVKLAFNWIRVPMLET